MNEERATHDTWCEISSDALRTNVHALRSLLPTSTKVLQVVKANAYGHGIENVVQVLRDACDAWGVATLDEAARVQAHSEKPVVLLRGTTNDVLRAAIRRGVEVFVWRKDQIDAALDEVAHAPVSTPTASTSTTAPTVHTSPTGRLHLDIDSGMARSGIKPAEFADFFASLSDVQRNAICALTTHLPLAASREADTETLDALAQFDACVRDARALGFRGIVHAANSAATLRFPQSHYDMVRLGIATFGLRASKFATLPDPCTPALSWKARITHIARLQPGDGVSYDWSYVAELPETVVAVPVGYADGFRRVPTDVGSVLIRGKHYPVIGRICMDQVIVRLDDDIKDDVALGDEVVIIGTSDAQTQSAQTQSAQECSVVWNTNVHDVVANISSRVPRITV